MSFPHMKVTLEGEARWLPKQSPILLKGGKCVDSVRGVAQHHHPGNTGQQLHKQQLAPQGGGEDSSSCRWE